MLQAGRKLASVEVLHFSSEDLHGPTSALSLPSCTFHAKVVSLMASSI